jgi:thioredoxin 1
MAFFTPKMFALCLALAIGPPVLLVAAHYNEWLAPKPIDPRFTTGEVLFFETSGCGACKMMKPKVAELKSQGFMIRTIDLNVHEQQAMDYGIHAVPTFVLVRDGQEVRRTSGVMSEDVLKQLWR